MRRSRFVPLAFVALVLPASVALAGDPKLIPSQQERPREFDQAEAVPFTPEFMTLPRLATPLTAGPAGQFGTVPIPFPQAEAAVASSGPFVVAGYNDDRGPFGLGIVRSTDGGATLLDGGQLPLPAGYFSSGDPAVAAWDPPGPPPPIFYVGSLVEFPSGNFGIVIHRSTDGGATWAGPFEVTPATIPGDFADREAIVVDPETGRLLVTWADFAPAGVTIRVSYSDDASTGAPPTWSPVSVVGARPEDGNATSIVVNPTNNDVYLVWLTYLGGNTRDVAFVRSIDNGTTWPAPSDLGPNFWALQCPYGFDRWLWSLSGSSLAYNPTDGGLELVYSASVNGTPTADFGDIFYRRSINGGATWSAPVPLNVFPGVDRPQANPCVSVATSGRIDVAWYDQWVGSGLSDYTDLAYCFSNDHGASWSSPVPVTSEPFHCESGNNFGAPHQGDYNGFAGVLAAGASYMAATVFARPSATGTGADPFVFTAAGLQVAPLRVRPGSVLVADHGCGTDDGVLVAKERGDITIPLENIGRASLSSIQATLSSLTPGVTVQPGARLYGSIASGASGAPTDVYRVWLDSSYPCGTDIRFRLDITATGVAPTFVEFSLPTGVVTGNVLLLSENFDGVVAPALPAGWTTSSGFAPTSPWRTTAVGAASGPNALFDLEAGTKIFERVNAPVLAIPAGTSLVQVTFDLKYDLKEYDSNYGLSAVTSDYRLDEAGNSHFSSGDAIDINYRYNHNIQRNSGDSGDRWGWSGKQLAYTPVRILYPGLAGHMFRTRWHQTTTGEYPGGGGAWVDNLQVRALTLGCGACLATDVPDESGGPSDALSLRVEGRNPFRGETSLRYSLPEPGVVAIEMYDVAGHLVRTLEGGWRPAGTYTVDLASRDGSSRSLAPGIYLVRLKKGVEARTVRIVALD